MARSLKQLPQTPWYKDGLSFKCTECGQCCTGSPGYTWVSEEEITRMAHYLKISIEEFSRRYLRRIGNRLSLRENPHNFDCVFLAGKKCTVYPVRPTQCQTFPWWPKNLEDPQAWQHAASFCEGITTEAPLVPLDTIEEQRKRQEDNLA